VLHLFGDCPDEASQLAGDGGGNDGQWLACPRQLAIPPAQPFLRLPRGVADRFGQTFLPQQLLATDPSVAERVQHLMEAHGLSEDVRPRLALGVLEVHVHLLEETRRRCLFLPRR
jgi:hypothetical protein